MSHDIRISHLNKSYDGKPVLEDVSLRFEAGIVTAICAPSGKGKTTLLRILAGLEKPDSGEITGVPEGTVIAYQFQEPRLFPSVSVLDNVMLVLHGKRNDIRARALSMLSALGITEDDAEKRPQALSGGMRQRAAVARLLLFAQETEAPLILLDEPFQGLDDERKRSVIALFKKVLSGKTVLFVTHDETEIEAFAAASCHLA